MTDPVVNPTGSILLRRGPTVDRLAFTPLAGELIYDTDTGEVYVGNGTTTGGQGIVEGHFPEPGVMIKGLGPNEYETRAGDSTSGGNLVQFLAYEKGSNTYSFVPVTSSGVALTNVTFSGVNNSGITVKRTDVTPNISNPLLTTTGTVTIGVDSSALKNTLTLNNVTNESKTTMFTNPAFTGSVTSNGEVAINSLTVSTSATTGALQVAGGVGIGGDLWITGSIHGSITGNAGTVTNGVVTTGSYSNPSWITGLAYSKITDPPAAYSLPTATTTILGGVKVDGTSITITNGVISGTAASYSLPTATTTILGGVKVDGTTIGITNGTISYSLPTATDTVLGGVKVDGTTIGITNGTISYSLPTASNTTLGGVKVDGTTITINNGIISGANTYSLPTANTSTLGGVKIDGTTIKITNQVISASITDITGNAGTVTAGVYTTGSYADPAWLTSLAYSKLTGTPAAYSLPTATTTTLGGVKIDGTTIKITAGVINANITDITGNAGTVTAGVYTTGSYADPAWITSLAASKVGLGNVTNESKTTMFSSAALTGTPTAPTAVNATNTTQIATTAFVQSLISDLVGSAPSALNTLKELSTAIGDDANFASTITTALSLKAPIASPSFTGHITTEGVTATGATGTGKFVFDNAPTISGHPTIEGVTSTGATGTGKLVFDTSPTFTTSIDSSATFGAFASSTSLTVGYTGTGAISTTNISTGALTGAFTKTINLGTGGTTGSTTTINIGSTIGTTTTFNGHLVVEGVTSTGATGTGKFVFDNAPTISGHPTIEGVTSTGATGTGKFVFDNAPTISGHPTIEGVTSTGATGTGKFVFDGSPTLVTPTIGVATATSINKMAITAPATSSTLAIQDGKTFTVKKTITLDGTDGTTITLPATTGTVALNDQTFYIGTTQIAINRASAAQTGASKLTGIDIDGNAATVSNGLYSTSSYADPAWITSLAYSKITGVPSGNITIGTTAIAPGGTSTTIGGLTQVGLTTGSTIRWGSTVQLKVTGSGTAGTASIFLNGGNPGFPNSTTSSQTVAIGEWASPYLTGNNAVSVGFGAAYSTTTASNNTVAGANALYFSQTGGNNAIFGANAAAGADTFNVLNTVAVGYNALTGIRSGTTNLAIGYQSGMSITTGSKNVVIGSNDGFTIATLSNNIIISDGDGNIRAQWDSIGTLTLTGTTVLQQSQEVFTAKSAATGTVEHNFTTGSTFYHSSVSASFTANITNMPSTAGRVTIVSIIIAQGVTPYICNGIQIAGVAQTIKWYTNVVPSGNANKVDTMVFTIINNAGTYTVLGQLSSYG